MQILSFYVWSGFLGLLIVGSSLLLFLSKFYKTQPQSSPYLAVPVLTNAERRFFLVLESVLPKRCYLLAQVRLANLVHVKPGSGVFWKHFSPIGMKCVDFVIVQRDTMTPLLIIELDDRTHTWTERRKRDQFVDQVLTSVALPILHWPMSAFYNRGELSQAILFTLGTNNR